MSENALTSTALLGYARSDFLKLKPLFGTWNPRELIDVQVRGHMESLRGGIERYVPDRLISLAIPKGAIKVDMLLTTLPLQDAYSPDTFPFLEFASEEVLANIKGLIKACGSQHRFEALRRLFREKSKTVDQLQKAYDKGSTAVAKGKGNTAAVRGILERIEVEKAKMKGLGIWGFKIYDLSKFAKIDFLYFLLN